ncbi:MAG TPA: aminotransferase class I/II-fold pyridoxal phosphate-dependent enzyme [Atribacterota bacterium]|nr:aminotransferase class I/II-fold pyridoxal phosphate-dependent enzyme [Atribacterota bacterium]
MKIKDFQVERWLDTYETRAQYELAETDAKPFTIEELNQLNPQDNLLKKLTKMKIGYNPTTGSDALRNKIANLYGSDTTSKNILVTTGAIEADFLLSNVLVNKGDKVIALWPAYQALYSTAEACGAQLEFWKLSAEDNFQPDLETLYKIIDNKTRLLVLNIPNNPTGAVINEQQLKTILQWAEKYNFYVLCDEVYHELIFQPGIVPTYARSLSKRAISVGSMSKAYGLSGVRLGWIAGPESIIEQCWSYKDYTSISNSPISDYLAQFALANFKRISERNHNIIVKNRETLKQWFEEHKKYFHYYLPEAGVLCFPKLRNIPISSKQLALDLFNQKSLLVVPGECFDMPNHLRIGFGGDTEKLEKSLSVFSAYLKENF